MSQINNPVLAYQQAHGLAIAASPTPEVYAAFAKMLNEMGQAGEPHDKMIVALCRGVVDGIEHGNWPGIVPEVSDSTGVDTAPAT